MPSFLLSLELFSILQPELPPQWNVRSVIAPFQAVTAESAVYLEDSCVVAAGTDLHLKAGSGEFRYAVGTVTAAGAATAITTPLPDTVKADASLSFTPHELTLSVPTQKPSGDRFLLAAAIEYPAAGAFFVWNQEGTCAGGLHAETADGSGIAFSIHRTMLPEHHARSWFAPEPYRQEQMLTTLQGTGCFLKQFSPGTGLKAEYTAGVSMPDYLDARWYSRSHMSLHLLQNQITLNTSLFFCDLDYLTPKATRMRTTVRMGSGFSCTPDSSAAGTGSVGIATTWSLYTPDTVQARSFWQRQYQGKIRWKTDTLESVLTMTCTGETPDPAEDTIAVTCRETLADGGMALTTELPVQYVFPQQLANGTLTVFMQPVPRIRLEGSFSFKTAELRKVTVTAALTAVHSKTTLKAAYSAEEKTLHCSVSTSAKWR